MKHIIPALMIVCLLAFPAFAETPIVGDYPDVINFSGSGVTICDPVTISNVPVRISFEQSEIGDFNVSCILDELNYSIAEGYYNDINGCAPMSKSGEYTFLVESDYDWSLTVEPLKDVAFEPLNGVGDCVTDIYTFSKPVIVTLHADFCDYENLVLYAYLETDHGWREEALFIELEDSGFSGDYKTILKLPQETRVYFALDFDESEWILDIA